MNMNVKSSQKVSGQDLFVSNWASTGTYGASRLRWQN